MIRTQTVIIILLGTVLSSCGDGRSKLAIGEELVLENESRLAQEMTERIKAVSQKRYSDGTVKRFNQAKSLGCLDAEFQVDEGLPALLQKGLFAQPGHYRAKVRFANASTEEDSEKDLRGMSIKVFGVQGKSLWGEDGVQDFILNSHPALFAATPEDFLGFIKATEQGRVWWYFVNPADMHLKALWMLFQARRHHTSPLDIRYWSTTPYRFGEDESSAVKYSVKPCSEVKGRLPDPLHSDYLGEAMQQQLRKAPACFDFMVQFQTDPSTMPVEDASVVWDESVSPFRKLATIIIRDQDLLSQESRSQCERVSFNPWQSLSAHRPLGGINRVRKVIYAELAKFRNTINQERTAASR